MVKKNKEFNFTVRGTGGGLVWKGELNFYGLSIDYDNARRSMSEYLDADTPNKGHETSLSYFYDETGENTIEATMDLHSSTELTPSTMTPAPPITYEPGNYYVIRILDGQPVEISSLRFYFQSDVIAGSGR